MDCPPSDPPQGFGDLLALRDRLDGYAVWPDPTRIEDLPPLDPESIDLSAYPCAQWVAVFNCEAGHKVGRIIVCGLEWCPGCGEMGSYHHLRRAVRLAPYVYSWDCFGYFVLTIPPEIAEGLSISDLFEIQAEFNELWHRRLQEFLGDQAVLHWHLFGDPPPDGRKPRKHPHLNMLTPTEWLEPEQLQAVREAWRKAVEKVVKEPVREPVINYRYASLKQFQARLGVEAGEREYCRVLWHKLKYIVRATFRDRSWAPDWADQLRRRKLTAVWGSKKFNLRLGALRWSRFTGRPVGRRRGCPICGAKLRFEWVLRWDEARVGVRFVSRDGWLVYRGPPPPAASPAVDDLAFRECCSDLLDSY